MINFLNSVFGNLRNFKSFFVSGTTYTYKNLSERIIIQRLLNQKIETLLE